MPADRGKTDRRDCEIKQEQRRKMTFRYAWKRSIPVMAGYIVLGMGFGMLLGAKGYVLGDRHERVYLRRSMQYVAIDLITEVRP